MLLATTGEKVEVDDLECRIANCDFPSRPITAHMLLPFLTHTVQTHHCSAVLLHTRHASLLGRSGCTQLTFCRSVPAAVIYGGYVRGYIAHEKGVLVLSKAKPFPTDRMQEPPRAAF